MRSFDDTASDLMRKRLAGATFPGPLTRESLLDALYCCGPVGEQQLTEHLHARGATFRAGELATHINALRAEQIVFVKEHSLPGVREAVTLYSLAGYGL